MVEKNMNIYGLGGRGYPELFGDKKNKKLPVFSRNEKVDMEGMEYDYGLWMH